jgi:hypothetical protein
MGFVSGVELLVRDEVHVVATWGRTFIQIWRGAPNAAASGRVNELARAFVKASPTPATSLFVVEAKSPAPDETTRKNFATFSRDIVSQMKLSVVVSEGGGFRGALVRAVGAALTTILPHRSAFKFVNDVPSAAHLLGPHLAPDSGGPEALVLVTEEVRSKIASPVSG